MIEPELPASTPAPGVGDVPPLSNQPPPALIDSPPQLSAGGPPPLIQQSQRKASSSRRLLLIVLSLYLAMFLADAVVSLLDDSLMLFAGAHLLTMLRAFTSLLAVLLAILIYFLMAITPAIPKRLFLPIVLFSPLASLLAIPFCIYTYGRIQLVTWAISLCQVIVGLVVFYRARGVLKLQWPLLSEDKLNPRSFSWQNLLFFLLGNIFLIVPAVAFYLFVCGALAADHFSDGFLSLRPSGLIVQVRKYVRPDGKTIQLVPMAHVGDALFYRNISRSFPADATILMEGVTDERNLLTNKISYHKMARSLGLAEQQNEFRPRGQIVRADIDVEEFAPGTIDLLNLVMFVHSRGLNAETLMKLLEYSPPPNFQQKLFDDILRKRNRHLLDEIHDQLPDSEIIIVPWGVAHMPEIAAEIQHQGFQLKETMKYAVIRFGSSGK